MFCSTFTEIFIRWISRRNVGTCWCKISSDRRIWYFTLRLLIIKIFKSWDVILTFFSFDINELWLKYFLSSSHPKIFLGYLTLFLFRPNWKLTDHVVRSISFLSLCLVSSSLSSHLFFKCWKFSWFSCTFSKSLIIM